jgi:hypothetical protein
MRKFSMILAMAASAATFTAIQVSHAEDRRDREVRKEERKEEAGWVKLGERKVDFKGDHDVIEVGRSEGKFTKLRIRVVEGDMELYKMKVTFEHGDPYEPSTRHEFKEGERSHDIDLPGDARTVKKVEFYYKSEHRRDPAVVELVGKEAK